MSLKLIWTSQTVAVSSSPKFSRRVRWHFIMMNVTVLTSMALGAPAIAHEIVETSPPPEQQPTDVRGLMQQWRESGDDAYLDTAQSMVEAAVARNSNDVSALIDMGIVAQARHDFELAESLAQDVLSRVGRNDPARLLLASIHLVRGDADAALEQCRALVQSPIPVILTCRARVAHARNMPEPSLSRLERVIALADRLAVDDGVRAWMLGVAGDLAVIAGRPDDAVEFFRESLKLARSTQVRAALTDVLLDSRLFEEALVEIDQNTRSLALIVRRWIALRELGRESEIEDAILDADHRFRHWIEHADFMHAREMARFYLDVLPRHELARELAAVNIGLQREPEDQQLVRRTEGPHGSTHDRRLQGD